MARKKDHPPRKEPFDYCKDPERYRAAVEASEKRAAEWQAKNADPEFRAKLEADLAAIRAAPLPWTEEGYEPTPIPDQEERTRRRLLMREHLKPKWEGVPHLVSFQVTVPKEKIKSMVKLKAARAKVRKLAGKVQDEAFKNWLYAWVANAERPDEWTQSRVLYENYLKRAKEYGNNRPDKRLSKEELATETQWGKMMGATYMKKRRAGGNYYPVRLKRGA